MNISPEIAAYLETIIQQSDQQDMTPELHQKMLEILAEQLNAYLVSQAIEQLSEEDLDQYQSLTQTNPEVVQVQQFLQQKIPHLDQLTQKSLIDFRQRYLENE